MNCKKRTKLTCLNCQHYDYCDIANRCDSSCWYCDITYCENNPQYDELNEENNKKIKY